jgi:hypothetical protein
MKNILLLIFLSLITLSGIAQKVKIKDNIAYVDGEAYLNWEKRSMANEASIMGINSSEEEVSMMYLNYSDPTKVSNSNPEGKVRWVEVNFLTLDLKCEVATRTHKGLAKLLYQSNIYVDGVLNEANATKFVKKYGMKFSDNRPGGNVNIIINN